MQPDDATEADREADPEADPEPQREQAVQVRAPFWGELTPQVAVGDVVDAAQVLATLEAVKLGAPITAPSAGTVTWLAPASPGTVRGGDLVAVLSRRAGGTPRGDRLSPG